MLARLRARLDERARSCAARPVASSRPSDNPASPRRIRTAYISNIRRKLPSPIAPARAKNWRMAAKGAAPSRACLRSDVQVSQRIGTARCNRPAASHGSPSNPWSRARSPPLWRQCDVEHIGQRLAIDALPLRRQYVRCLATRDGVPAPRRDANGPGPQPEHHPSAASHRRFAEYCSDQAMP